MKSAKQDFQEVQKALHLKRLEHPPSRFFQSFPAAVMQRINTGGPDGRAWYERLGFGDNWKLGLLCLLGLVICTVLAVGLAVAHKVPPAIEPPGGPQDDPAAAIYSVPPNSSNTVGPAFQPVPGVEGTPDSTKPVMAPGSTSGGPGSMPVPAQESGRKSARP
jgi:hypothetical protein